MPIYEYHCDKCEREVTLTLTISQHEKGKIECPKCGGKALRPLLSAFMSQTSKKPNRHSPSSSSPPKRVRAADRIGMRVAVSTATVRVIASTFAYLSVLFAGLPLSYVSAQPRLEEPAPGEEIDCGIVRLRALAVFRFMTNSNLQRARRRASVSLAVGAVAAETFEALNFPGSTSSTVNVDLKQY